MPALYRLQKAIHILVIISTLTASMMLASRIMKFLEIWGPFFHFPWRTHISELFTAHKQEWNGTRICTSSDSPNVFLANKTTPKPPVFSRRVVFYSYPPPNIISCFFTVTTPPTYTHTHLPSLTLLTLARNVCWIIQQFMPQWVLKSCPQIKDYFAGGGREIFVFVAFLLSFFFLFSFSKDATFPRIFYLTLKNCNKN